MACVSEKRRLSPMPPCSAACTSGREAWFSMARASASLSASTSPCSMRNVTRKGGETEAMLSAMLCRSSVDSIVQAEAAWRMERSASRLSSIFNLTISATATVAITMVMTMPVQ